MKGKVLVCGKGGSGKSTVVALLSRELSTSNRVLVVDNDESNYLLPSLLGLSSPPDFMNYFGGKRVIFDKLGDLKKGWKLADLPSGYVSKTQGGNLGILTVGKIREYGEGCACPMNALSQRFLESVTLDKGEFVIVDTDAGIEHFGRGVERGIDLILIVIDPSRESINIAKKVSAFGEKIKKPVYFILNRVDEESRSSLLESLDPERVKAIIGNDRKILRSGLNGEELDLTISGIGELAQFIERGTWHDICPNQ